MATSSLAIRFAVQRVRTVAAAASVSYSCNTVRSIGRLPKCEGRNHRLESAITSRLRLFSSSSALSENNESDDSGNSIEGEISENSHKVTTEDEHKEETQRRRLRDVKISEVLDAKHAHRWVDPMIIHGATLKEAIETVIEGGLSGMMVVESNQHKKVLGLLTSRDLLRVMAAAIKDGDSNDDIMNRPIVDFMTPISQVVFARPDETIGMCRTIMAKLGIKCLPVLSKEGRVEGLITARDMSDFGLTAADRGGKKNYLNDISERVGLSTNTSMAEPPAFLHAHLALEQSQSPLFVNIGVAELPHPFKSEGGVSRNQRDHGPQDPSTDSSLSEDAHFTTRVRLPDEKTGEIRDFTYFGVADGVGSWREYDVDPREFSHRLMEECENVLLEACHEAPKEGKKSRRVIAPADILEKAYARVREDNVIGSSTACVALFDTIRHQLHFSNLGDSGIIVLRHIDSDVAGSLKRDRVTPRTERTSDLRVAFVSQQQLHSFNHPYQLGWTGEELGLERTSFKTARDSCTTSIHVRRGDIIIMASDGLFDNVDIDDITKVGLEWEQQVGLIRGGDIAAREKRWQMGNSLTLLSKERVFDLASDLCDMAREKSLDSLTDSPFAILAKENDIMWSGGMPDDCTVIVAHVVGRSADDIMDKDHQ